MQVAGTRYYLNYEQAASIDLGASVELQCDNDNSFDGQAIALLVDGKIIGYVNKLMCSTLRSLMKTNISCRVAKISGTQERPLIYVMISVK